MELIGSIFAFVLILRLVRLVGRVDSVLLSRCVVGKTNFRLALNDDGLNLNIHTAE